MIETVTGPAFAAPYLINGDASGLSDEERAMVDAWCRDRGIDHVLDCSDEEWFTWCYDFYFPQGNARGGSVLDYVCQLRV